jgi:hypothetical protein
LATARIQRGDALGLAAGDDCESLLVFLVCLRAFSGAFGLETFWFGAVVDAVRVA